MGWKSRVEVTPGFCIFWAFLILTLPLNFLLAALGAALFHECCHGAAVKLSRGRILSITLGAGGIMMEVESDRELLCAIAGPVGSLLLACLPVKNLAICGLAQGIFNLLPIMPLDGGRVFRIILDRTVPQFRSRIDRAVEVTICILFLIVAFHLGTGAVLLWVTFVYRKFPCKPWGKRVQ